MPPSAAAMMPAVAAAVMPIAVMTPMIAVAAAAVIFLIVPVEPRARDRRRRDDHRENYENACHVASESRRPPGDQTYRRARTAQSFASSNLRSATVRSGLRGSVSAIHLAMSPNGLLIVCESSRKCPD
jgi:hypothetical protein